MVHAVLGVQAHNVDEVLGGQRVQVALVVDDGVVHRHGADHRRALGGELRAEGLGVAVGREVHDGVRAHVHGGHHLLHLHIVVLAVARHAEIDVNLRAQHRAHALGIEALVPLVGADDHLSLGHQRHELLYAHALLLRHAPELFGDDPLAGRLHLGRVFPHENPSSYFAGKQKAMRRAGASHRICIRDPYVGITQIRFPEVKPPKGRSARSLSALCGLPLHIELYIAYHILRICQ